jgi:hypothetical protein
LDSGIVEALGQNPLTADPRELEDIPIIETFLEVGRYTAGEAGSSIMGERSIVDGIRPVSVI